MEKRYLSNYLLILFGGIMAVGVFLKLVLNLKIDSDWFWFLAGVGVVVEGIMAYQKQRKFDKKFKIVEREY